MRGEIGGGCSPAGRPAANAALDVAIVVRLGGAFEAVISGGGDVSAAVLLVVFDLA